ncbi:MAG: hypothetical protein LQ351_004055 [Letrouitia transgressa]|nr:MAG: hypothetical protein LQ351_004055 [Letrouitia transgressa]
MSAITKVALAGATGNLGPAILAELLSAGFQVTVLTREGSTHSFPPSVTVIPVDYTAVDSVTNALKGHDALVSTLASLAVGVQLNLVLAASNAGIKRFIPSEFGSNTLNPKSRGLPVYKDKIAVQNALQKEANAGTLSYTLVFNGPFLDWGLKVGFIANVREKSANLFDGGNRLFSTTTLHTIGKAVVGVLKHPGETKNRAVYVHDTATTLKKIVEMVKKATGGPEGWRETVIPVDKLLEGAWAELKKENPDPGNFVQPFLAAGIWGEGYGCHFEKTDNELLGIREMTDDDVQQLANSLTK